VSMDTDWWRETQTRNTRGKSKQTESQKKPSGDTHSMTKTL